MNKVFEILEMELSLLLFKKIIQKLFIFTYNVFYYLNKTNNNTIIFESNLGKNYSGNPKAIYERMVERGLDREFKCVWVLNDTGRHVNIPGKHKKIKRMRFNYLYYITMAGVFIFDSRQPLFFKKKSDMKFIQTWHGTPLKKLALDMEVINMGGERDLIGYQERFKLSTSKWDYLLSQNSYSSAIFRSAFAYDQSILETGYPRNDILVNASRQNIYDLKNKLRIPSDKKIILYAPTWRDNKFHKKGQYKFTTELNIRELFNELQDEFVLLIKAHYLVVDSINSAEYDGFVYEFGNDIDISELYLIADVLVTDYSSVMFDYSVTRKKMVFYTYDLEEYRDSLRGFYFDFEENIPGPVVENMPDLISALYMSDKTFFDIYGDKYKAFINKFNYLDDGRSSDRVIDQLIIRK